MKRSFVYSCCILCLSIFSNNIQAQIEDNIWVFREYAALDLNSGAPVSLAGYGLYSLSPGYEAAASISDNMGNILFYSGAEQVWNKLHIPMPNGTGLATFLPETSTQGAVISKYPGSDSLYYLFTIDARGAMPGYLRYHIIDMSLDGGNGDIIATEKNVILDSFVHEKMTITRDDGCYYWLVTYSYINQEYHSFRITEAGIEPPVVSTSITPNGGIGELEISPDGTRLANTSYMPHIEMANFNKSTGVVSGFLSINLSPNTFPFARTYGCSFSPDGSKLYMSNEFDIYQFDLTAWPSEPAIESSIYNVVTLAANDPQLRLASNGKIYFPTPFSNNINVINSPNLLGAACNPVLSAVTLTPGSSVGFGIGASVVVNDPTVVTIGRTDSFTYCYVDSQKLVAPFGQDVYMWDDGSDDQTRTIYSSGTYWMRYGTSCHQTVDTFHITIVSDDIYIHNDNPTTACWGEVIDLVADDVPGYTYAWMPSTGIADTTSPVTTMVATNGVITLKVSYPGCPDFFRSFSLFTIDCFPIDPISGTLPLDNIGQRNIQSVPGDTDFDMAVYPNPTYDNVSVIIKGRQGINGSIQVGDLMGRILGTWKITDGETGIDMSNLSPGMYFIQHTDHPQLKTVIVKK